MFPCPRCGKPVPEVLGAATQRCPHCEVVIEPRAPPPDAGRLLAEGFADLVGGAPRWWLLFLPSALVVDAATWGLALADPAFAAFFTGCGGGVGGSGPLFYGGVVAWLAVSLAAYFVGWALVAAEATGTPRPRRWWRDVLLGSALLAALFTVGGLLVVPGILFLVWFLLAPVALGAGASPLAALDAGRAVGRRRPPGFTLLVLLLVAGVEVALVLAACVPGFAGSLAAQGLVWWLLAPVVPVVTARAWTRLAAPRETS